jgi:hypothetical protein
MEDVARLHSENKHLRKSIRNSDRDQLREDIDTLAFELEEAKRALHEHLPRLRADALRAIVRDGHDETPTVYAARTSASRALIDPRHFRLRARS